MKVLKRDQDIFLARPLSKFAKVEKVISESQVEVSYYKDSTFTDRETTIVSADIIRIINDITPVDTEKKVTKKKKVVKTKKTDFNSDELDELLEDLVW